MSEKPNHREWSQWLGFFKVLVTVACFVLVFVVAIVCWTCWSYYSSQDPGPRSQHRAKRTHRARKACAFKSLRCLVTNSPLPDSQEEDHGEKNGKPFEQSFQEWLQTQVPSKSLEKGDLLTLAKNAANLRKKLEAEEQSNPKAAEFIKIISDRELLKTQIMEYVRSWSKWDKFCLWRVYNNAEVEISDAMGFRKACGVV